MRTERPLNDLELLFAQCNVRFAMMVDLGEQDQDSEETLFQQVQNACRSCRLGHLALHRTHEDHWKLVTDTSDEQEIAKVISYNTIIDYGENEDIGRLLDKLVHEETEPAEGTLSVRLISCRCENQLKNEAYYGDDKSSSNAPKVRRLLYVNGNHAICDGRALCHFVAVATGVLPPPDMATWRDHTLPDWKALVEEASSFWEGYEEEPPSSDFHSKSNNGFLTIQELSSGCINRSTGTESLRYEIAPSTVTKIRQILKKYAPGATMSGFLVALLMHSIAMVYKKKKNDKTCRDMGVSVLVDLRPFLSSTSNHNDDILQINQAHGTVTLMDTTDTWLRDIRDATGNDSNDTVDDSNNNIQNDVVDLLLTKSTQLTEQLQRRIQRGEPHRSAMALLSGRFEDAGPPATMELSNLGVCYIPSRSQLFTAQRFDGYDGVSCMVHSEGNGTECMRWNASVGHGLDVEVVEQILDRALECLNTVVCPSTLQI